jgi:hypothetical protein
MEKLAGRQKAPSTDVLFYGTNTVGRVANPPQQFRRVTSLTYESSKLQYHLIKDLSMGLMRDMSGDHFAAPGSALPFCK